MKKKIVAIMACAMMLLSAGASAEMTAGTYTGEGQGIGGAVKVAVTVEGGAITAVEVVEHAETAGICDPAIEKIPAAIVAAQSLAVDPVTSPWTPCSPPSRTRPNIIRSTTRQRPPSRR